MLKAIIATPTCDNKAAARHTKPKKQPQSRVVSHLARELQNPASVFSTTSGVCRRSRHGPVGTARGDLGVKQ
jgi:hypothetical protein